MGTFVSYSTIHVEWKNAHVVSVPSTCRLSASRPPSLSLVFSFNAPTSLFNEGCVLRRVVDSCATDMNRPLAYSRAKDGGGDTEVGGLVERA